MAPLTGPTRGAAETCQAKRAGLQRISSKRKKGQLCSWKPRLPVLAEQPKFAPPKALVFQPLSPELSLKQICTPHLENIVTRRRLRTRKFMQCVILLEPGGSLSRRSGKLRPISKKMQSGLVLIADTLFLCLQLHLHLEASSPCGACKPTRLTAKIQAPVSHPGGSCRNSDLTL